MGFIDGVRCYTRKVDNFVQGDGVKHNFGRENRLRKGLHVYFQFSALRFAKFGREREL